MKEKAGSEKRARTHRLKSGHAVELKLTEDGSHTLYVPELNEHYHSVFGARTESMHVFIENGLKHLNKKNIKILEIGFGTGLNALLTILNKGATNIEYHSLEKYPLSAEVENSLLFSPEQTAFETDIFKRIHATPWNQPGSVAPGFTLLKQEADLLTFHFSDSYDLVYFDAFAPDVQPELWTEGVFQKIFSAMNSEGVITTYSAKGEVRRTLQKVGFKVERLPGPPGKREMLRGTKP